MKKGLKGISAWLSVLVAASAMGLGTLQSAAHFAWDGDMQRGYFANYVGFDTLLLEVGESRTMAMSGVLEVINPSPDIYSIRKQGAKVIIEGKKAGGTRLQIRMPMLLHSRSVGIADSSRISGYVLPTLWNFKKDEYDNTNVYHKMIFYKTPAGVYPKNDFSDTKAYQNMSEAECRKQVKWSCPNKEQGFDITEDGTLLVPKSYQNEKDVLFVGSFVDRFGATRSFSITMHIDESPLLC